MAYLEDECSKSRIYLRVYNLCKSYTDILYQEAACHIIANDKALRDDMNQKALSQLNLDLPELDFIFNMHKPQIQSGYPMIVLYLYFFSNCYELIGHIKKNFTKNCEEFVLAEQAEKCLFTDKINKRIRNAIVHFDYEIIPSNLGDATIRFHDREKKFALSLKDVMQSSVQLYTEFVLPLFLSKNFAQWGSDYVAEKNKESNSLTEAEKATLKRAHEVFLFKQKNKISNRKSSFPLTHILASEDKKN